MNNVEIERKFKIKSIPSDLNQYKSCKIEQAYINYAPVIRIRKQDDDYILTYKGGGFLAHPEYNLPLGKEGYDNLLTKADGNIITKTRYFIPINDGLTAELDVFEGMFDGLVFVEVEFESLDEATAFTPPEWFDEDVTNDKRYHNSYLSKLKEFNIDEF